MTIDAVLSRVVDALERAGVPYMIVGSLSSSLYGVTRSTKDADIVLDAGSAPIRDVVQHLGPEFRLERQMTFESVTATTRHIVHATGAGVTVEFFRLSDDEHDQERFRRRRRVHLPMIARDAWLPSAEDVIVTKLRWALGASRGKDRDDVREVIAVQQDALDWPYVERWCDRHGTRALLEVLRREAMPD